MLPPVIPIVFYTGGVTWGSATKLREVVDGPPELKARLPDWGPDFWSLADRSVETLLSGGAWMQFLAVVRAEGSDAAEFERVFKAAVTHLAALRQSDQVRWYELLSIVLGYAMFRREKPLHPRLREIAVASAPEKREEIGSMSMTIWESAVAEGEQKGELKTARRALLDVLEERFGQPSDEWKQRIEAVDDPDRLRAALKRSVKLGRLDELEL